VHWLEAEKDTARLLRQKELEKTDPEGFSKRSIFADKFSDTFCSVAVLRKYNAYEHVSLGLVPKSLKTKGLLGIIQLISKDEPSDQVQKKLVAFFDSLWIDNLAMELLLKGVIAEAEIASQPGEAVQDIFAGYLEGQNKAERCPPFALELVAACWKCHLEVVHFRSSQEVKTQKFGKGRSLLHLKLFQIENSFFLLVR